jgi:large subunit ribosomal protein L17
MRHGVGYRKFQKSAAHTRAMFRNMATSLILHEQIETTVEKAKELRPIVEKLITRAKKDTLPARRIAYSYLKDKAVVHKLFVEVGPRFSARNGGYTRVIRSRKRAGDAASMAIIALVEQKPRAASKKVSSDKGTAEQAAE